MRAALVFAKRFKQGCKGLIKGQVQLKEAGSKGVRGNKPQQFVWFYGPAVISIYQFGRDRGFLQPSIYEKVLSDGGSSLDPNFSLSFEQVNRDMETILEKDPSAFDAFWRETGLKQPMVARISYAVTQATIKSAIQCVADTRLMDTNVVYNTTIETPETFSIRILPRIPIYDWQHHFFVAQFLSGITRLSKSGALPIQALIYRGRPMAVTDYLNRQVELGVTSDQVTEVVWAKDQVEQPSILANEGIASHFKALIQPTLQARADSDGVGGRVLNYIDQACRSFEKVSMPLAAEAFQMETSTLRRRLALEDTKFSEILQNYRRKESMRLLSHGHPVKDVSKMLGYSEPSSFQHAFRIWYSASPKRFLRNPAVSSPATPDLK